MRFLRGWKSWRKSSVAVAGLGLSVLLVAACSSSGSSSAATSSTNSASSSKGTFRVLAIIDTSGDASAYGPQQLIALQGSVAYWNAHGGIGGEHVVLSYVNGNSDPATAVTSLIQWISSNGKPNMVWDGESGIDDSGIPPEIKRLDVLDIGQDSANVCSANAQQTCPTRFVPVPLTTVNMAATAAFMKQQGYKKVGLLAEEDGFSQSEVPLLQAALKAEGISTVVATFPLTAVDVTPEVTQLSSSGVDAIWGAALGPAAGYVISARSNLGLVQKLPVVFDAGAGAQDLTKLGTPASLQNAYESTARPQDPNVNLPGRTELYKYSASYGTLDQPLPASIAWDSLVLAHDAAAQAGSVSLQPMVNALLNLSKAGQDDPLYMYPDKVGFTASNHQDVLATISTYAVVKVGTLNAQGEVTTSGG